MTKQAKESSQGADYWQEHGWTKKLIDGFEMYTGEYVVSRGENRHAYGGIILMHKVPSVQMEGLQFAERISLDVMVHNPPPEIKNHKEGHCFQFVGEDTFRVHYNVEPHTVDEAILHIQKVFAESLFPNEL